jgi:hypothetical protein
MVKAFDLTIKKWVNVVDPKKKSIKVKGKIRQTIVGKSSVTGKNVSIIIASNAKNEIKKKN